MHTLALSQMILKKNDQIIGLEEKWILFEQKDNNCISAEIYMDIAVLIWKFLKNG